MWVGTYIVYVYTDGCKGVQQKLGKHKTKFSWAYLKYIKRPGSTLCDKFNKLTVGAFIKNQ